MPRLLPPYIDRGCKSTAEKQIFKLIQSSPFAKDWIVLHSLNLSKHTVRLYGEIDFLLLIPKCGIYVMEVKGGDVKCIDGVWYFTDRYGNTNKNKNPFNQARDAMFSLKVAIEKQFGKRHRFTRIMSGFFCAFPHISFNKHSIEYEPWQVMDKGAVLHRTEEFFRELIDQTIQNNSSQLWFSEKESLPDEKDLLELCDFLRGDFERVRTAMDRLSEFENEVKRYTEEQYHILDSIRLNNRSVIQGSAGTGKTMIAIESAVRAAAEGQKVLLTCYNRLIGEWMQKQLVGWEEKITVSSLHLLLFEQSKGFDYDRSQGGKQDFYNRYLPLLLKDIYQIGVSEKYDRLIIDEGQDLIRPEYLALFDAMLCGGLAGGCWEIYGDFEKQAIYSQVPKAEMFGLLSKSGLYARFMLTKNCRNTRQIGEETSLLSGFEQPPYLLEHLDGLPVEYHFYKNEADQKTLLVEQLKKISERKLPLQELIIISSRKIEHSCVGSLTGFTVKEIKSTIIVGADQDCWGFATIHSYKGMESNYVIITDIEDLTTEAARSLLYIGMSRAKYGLVLLISESIRTEYQEILKRKLR